VVIAANETEVPVLKNNTTKKCAVEINLYAFLTSSLYGGEWLTSRSECFTPGNRLGRLQILSGGDAEEKNSYLCRSSSIPS
jgi:hypothetical protein